jgi:translocation and assembly module TamB
MGLLLRILLSIIAAAVLLSVIAVGGVWVGLNTVAGRVFAVREINRFAGPEISVSGLSGHFPTDIKLSSVSVADKNGIWLTGGNLELLWNPLKLLHRTVSVASLSAASLDVVRQPVPGKPSQGSSSSSLPKFRLDVDRLAVPALRLGAALGGEEVSLNVTGAAHFLDVTKGAATLNATTPDGSAVYALNAGIDSKTVSMKLHVAEPPDGLLGHYAGPLVHEPLALDVSVAGPTDAAALNFNMALGAAQLNGVGTLGLDPENPKADVMLSVPALAPFGALAGKAIAGSTKLHLVVANHDGSSSLALDGDVALTDAPGGLAKLVGPAGRLALLVNLHDHTVNIQNLDIDGAEFEFSANGSVAQSGVNLSTHAVLKQIAALSPGISGNVSEDGTIIGTAGDFAIDALLTGDIDEKNIPSGPFSISIDAQHLPRTPSGTLTGSGALENSPLLLDAAFSRDADGAVSVTINNALWRSLNAQADLALAAGATLPTGTAKFAVGQLGDFAPFSPVPLRGSVTGDFSHLDGEKFKLDLNARNLVADPHIGAVNATLSALGPTNALATRLQATVAKLVSAPARLALAGVFNLDARSATISSLSASWREINAVLQGPAGIATRPGIAVRHLVLDVNGGRVGVDGTLTPNLNATLNVQDLPASLARQFAPSMNASGTLSASATLTGSIAAPNGRLTLNAQNIKLHNGPAAAMSAANFTGSATIAGKTATINTKLTAGPNVSLAADGLVPLNQSGALNLHVTGRTDLRLLDPILAVEGSIVRGVVTADITVTGNATSPRANGNITLTDGSVENIGSGLNLTHMAAGVQATGRLVTLRNFQATAGQGSITGHGTVDLGTPDIPLDLTVDADNATPIASDIVTENLDAALSLKGALHGKMALGGTVKIDKANINIPKSLPPSVANLTIINAGAKPPPPPPPPPPVSLDLLVTASNQIFVRGDGLFAELGGRLRITGTAANPNPEGGFELIRGNFSLAGKTLQFTTGNVSFNGAGFMPTLDFEASTVTTDNNTTATLIVGGTAAKPTITLTSSPPLPSDEILSQLLFGQSTTSLSPFQAASLAAALAQLSGLGGGANPLDKVRNALGLDELSLTGSGSGPPSLEAGRYVAPGVYVGATQATNGQGTQASVQINLYKGLKLETSTGTSGAGTGNASSVGLTYQFNY